MDNKELLAFQLEQIYRVFPERPPFLQLSEAARFLGMDPQTLQADRTFPLKQMGKRSYRVNTVAMARWMLAGC